MKQRRKKDCVIAALATARGISYPAARKIVQAFCPDSTNGVPDKTIRLLIEKELGSVQFACLGVDNKGYPVQQTWGQWLAEHQAGRYMVSVWSLAADGLYGAKHCVGVVGGQCNDPTVLDIQLVDWWAVIR